MQVLIQEKRKGSPNLLILRFISFSKSRLYPKQHLPAFSTTESTHSPKLLSLNARNQPTNRSKEAHNFLFFLKCRTIWASFCLSKSTATSFIMVMAFRISCKKQRNPTLNHSKRAKKWGWGEQCFGKQWDDTAIRD